MADEVLAAMVEAVEAALRVREEALKMNREAGFAIFDEPDEATAGAILAVLNQNGWKLVKAEEAPLPRRLVGYEG